MVSNKLSQILKSPDTIWAKCVPAQLKTICDNKFNNRSNYSCASRTLTDVLNHTINSWFDAMNSYKILITMCTLLTEQNIVDFQPYYTPITTEDRVNSLEELITHCNIHPSGKANNFTIYLYHIPKGKSYLKKILNTTPNLTRLTAIEQLCIEDTQHFIRIYKNFPNTIQNSITIFADKYSVHLINTLHVLLPHLMDIKPIVTPTNEKEILYNKRQAILNTLFTELFDSMKCSSTANLSDAEINHLILKFKELLTHYTNTFDFITDQLNIFVKQLANTRNQIALSHFNNQLNQLNRDINDCERTLQERYIQKANTERAIISHRMLTEDNINPFIESIKESKAIEIINTTNTKLTLKITAPLQYFQETDFEAYEKNPMSTYNQQFANNPTLKQILHKIFVTREYQILFQGIIHLTLQTSSYVSEPLSIHAEKYDLNLYDQYPNPHLYYYDCWRAAKNEIQKNICEGNFDLIPAQIIAAVQSINVAEPQSFVNHFLQDIKYSGNISNRLNSKMTFIIPTPEGKIHLNLKQLYIHEQQLALEAAKQQNPKNTYTQIEIPNAEDDEEEDENEEN